LWQVMRGPSPQHSLEPPVIVPSREAIPHPNVSEVAEPAATAASSPVSDAAPVDHPSPVAQAAVGTADEMVVVEVDDDAAVTAAPSPSQRQHSSDAQFSRQDRWLVAAGLLAVALSAGALLPSIFFSFPAAVCGLMVVWRAAVLWLSVSSTSQQRRTALVAAALGALGLLLGPLVLAPWRQAALARGSGYTAGNLRRIGQALQQHHAEHHAFPLGAATLRNGPGPPRSGPGWLSRLLPYVGAERVYQQIDFTQPYDAEVNRPALATPIPAYYTTDGDRAPVAGFAVAHFAGVGGTVEDSRGTLHAAGLFERDRAITAADVTDGLSHTVAAGEIPGGYPPWGDPENWRTFGRGINREVRGFGNAAGTGAWLLFADGQVRFFSNRTDPEVLRRLSTRSAADTAAAPAP
jgi:hypothetical protein